MVKRPKKDTLALGIERALGLGQFISYGRSWKFVAQLEDAKSGIDALVANGEARRAAELYELFLSGCYDKAEEIDDSGGNLGMFFQELFISWIDARQQAGCQPDETVRQILRWMDNDDYGFCYRIEEDVAKVLNRASFALFRKHFQDQFNAAFAPLRAQEPKCIYDYPAAVHQAAAVLKALHVAKKDAKSYQALCDVTLAAPKDCENIATLLKAKRRFADALVCVQKGLALEEERRWGNQSSHALTGLRQELLCKVGRREDALEAAWSDFRACPCVYGYADVMKYVPKKESQHWHQKALRVARRSSLDAFIEICVKTNEWDLLAERIVSASHGALEGLSHYVTEKAAAGLARKHVSEAAKIFGALGMRILSSGKSKYYRHALEHFRKARKLWTKAGRNRRWSSLVARVRKEHSRKYSFIGGLEDIVEGRGPDSPEDFEKRARRRRRANIEMREVAAGESAEDSFSVHRDDVQGA